MVTLQQRNYFKSGEEVEFFGPEIENVRIVIGEIKNSKGQVLDAARHPLEVVQFTCPIKLYPNNMMRKGMK
jgi:U32 family peptidase